MIAFDNVNVYIYIHVYIYACQIRIVYIVKKVIRGVGLLMSVTCINLAAEYGPNQFVDIATNRCCSWQTLQEVYKNHLKLRV